METREPEEFPPEEQEQTIGIPEKRDTTESVITKRELEEIGFYILAPGTLGGLAKVLWELESSQGTNQAVEERPLDQNNYGFWLGSLPTNLFLGAISALIGIFLLADLIDFKKNKFKIIASALVFGMTFPAVFEAASVNEQLRLRVKETELQVTESNLEVAIEADNPQAKEKAIENIENIAVTAKDPNVQTKARQSIEKVAVKSQETEVKVKAIDSLDNVVTNTKDSRKVQLNAVQSIENIAIQAEEAEVGQKAIATLKQIQSEVKNEEVQNQAQKSIEKIEAGVTPPQPPPPTSPPSPIESPTTPTPRPTQT